MHLIVKPSDRQAGRHRDGRSARQREACQLKMAGGPCQQPVARASPHARPAAGAEALWPRPHGRLRVQHPALLLRRQLRQPAGGCGRASSGRDMGGRPTGQAEGRGGAPRQRGRPWRQLLRSRRRLASTAASQRQPASIGRCPAAAPEPPPDRRIVHLGRHPEAGQPGGHLSPVGDPQRRRQAQCQEGGAAGVDEVARQAGVGALHRHRGKGRRAADARVVRRGSRGGDADRRQHAGLAWAARSAVRSRQAAGGRALTTAASVLSPRSSCSQNSAWAALPLVSFWTA